MEQKQMSDTLSQLSDAVKTLLAQSRERDLHTHQIREQLAVVGQSVDRLVRIIDDGGLVEKIVRLEGQREDSNTRIMELRIKILEIEKERAADKNKLLWMMLGLVGSVLLSLFNFFINKPH